MAFPKSNLQKAQEELRSLRKEGSDLLRIFDRDQNSSLEATARFSFVAGSQSAGATKEVGTIQHGSSSGSMES